MTEVSPALALRGVSAGYGDVTVLRDVDLTVPAGCVVALLGPNGAGKTTLLRTAAGLLRPTAGEVHLHGERVTSRPAHRRARLGLCLIPEGRGVFRHLTVRENLRLQVAAGADADAAIDEALSVFPALSRLLNQATGRLSGGQQQMVALSRAFITRPEVVLLDEVSMGLAPIIVDQIFEALATLSERGVAVLLVEQYVHQALALATQVVLMNQGEITFSGPASDINEDAVVSSYLGQGT